MPQPRYGTARSGRRSGIMMRHQFPQPRLDAGDVRAMIRRMRQAAERTDQAIEAAREQLARLTILLGQLEQRRGVTKK
jgi:hypothetical protein